MRLKSYFAQSIGDALESARQELGPDAMLLNSRKTGAEQSYLGEFEVVFGITGNPPVQKKPAIPAERPAVSKQSGMKRIFPDLIAPEPEAGLKESVDDLAEQVVPSPAKRVLPELTSSEPKSPASTETETSTFAAAVSAATKQIAAEPAASEPSPLVRTHAEAGSPTKPLFPKPVASTSPAPPAAAAESADGPSVPPVEQMSSLATAPSQSSKPSAVTAEDLAHELAELRKQLQTVSQSLTGGLAARAAVPRNPAEDPLFSRLLAFDFSEEFSRDLIGSAAQSKMSEFASMLRSPNNSAQSNSAPSAKSILAQVKSRIAVDPGVGKRDAPRRVVMFVGPPGAGKTTSIVKLAVQLGLEQELPVQLLSLDTFRVAGAEQLNAFGRILGVGFTALHTPEALAEALEEHRDKKLILVDTPGYSGADEEEMENTAAFFRNHPEVEVQLVLPATARRSTLLRYVERFSTFQPSRVIYTHLDEVDTLGPVVENAIAAALPISFLTDGQAIPQDVHEATKDRLLQGLFATARMAAVSAA